MIEIHSKYDNMHINVMFYALICINNHVLSCLDCMLSRLSDGEDDPATHGKVWGRGVVTGWIEVGGAGNGAGVEIVEG